MLPLDLSNLTTLPIVFRETAKAMIKNLPSKTGEAFLTVHGKFVKKAKTLRRGAPHIDGNYIKEVSEWGSGGGNGWKVGEFRILLRQSRPPQPSAPTLDHAAAWRTSEKSPFI